MARPKAPVGELGAVQYTRLASGTIRARARMRDDGGAVHQLRAVGSSEQAALAELRRKALALTTGGGSGLSPLSTIAEAGEAWLRHLETRTKSGSLAHSTFTSYETTLRLILVPRCGAIPLEALTVGRCDRIIQTLLTEETLSKARRARAVLSLICGYAVRDDAMPLNPVRDVQRLPLPEKKTSAPTPEQIAAIRDLMRAWREDHGYGPRPDYRALIDGMDIMLGSSARIGECLGLRRCDVDMTTAPPTLLIDGTIVQTKAEGLHRKNAPKRTRQRRRIALPAAAASAVRRRLAFAGKGAGAFLFPTKTGRPMSVSNYERLLRSFVDDNREALIALGVEVGEYTTHLYRRTTATLVERAAGLTLASRLLGHANEQITRASYVVTAESVDPVTADILDAVLGQWG